MKFKDLSGLKFNHLEILYVDKSSNPKHLKYFCKCDCGKIKSISGYHVEKGKIKSCGCMRDKYIHSTHKQSKTRLYGIWTNIKSRCFNPKYHCYTIYGDRGISMCNEWKESFEPFYEWSMANGYKDNLSIDRIDNNADYCPENCRWADRKTQNNNKRNNHKITINGETKNLTQWADSLGINRDEFSYRVLRYKDIEEVLRYFECKKQNKPYLKGDEIIVTVKGETNSLANICKKYNVSYDLIYGRYKLNWDIEKAIFTPKLRQGR